MIRFEQYKKSFGSMPVIEIADLELAKNVYWLQGANGSGKTTLLKCIAGLLPFDGKISVADIDLRTKRKIYLRIVNFAEAEPLYPAFLTSTDLISLYEKTKRGSIKKAEEIKHALGIEQYEHQKIGTYSSGMVKKLSLLLAFMGEPQLILLDEPLITLDQQAIETMIQLIEEYRNNGVGFIITSHQPFKLPLAATNTLYVKNKSLSFQ